MATIAQARAAATKKRKDREAAEAAAAAAAAKKPTKKKEPSLLDRVRAAFSSEDDIKRIEGALEAVEGGINEANEDSKRKK